MIYSMYSIKDELNGYTTPIPMLSDNIAKRYFKDQIMGNPTMGNTPEDFSIWKMGTFDTESGTYIQKADDIKLLERGKAHVNSNEN